MVDYGLMMLLQVFQILIIMPTMHQAHKVVKNNERYLNNYYFQMCWFVLLDIVCDRQGAPNHSSKGLPATSIYGANEFLASYRYSLGASHLSSAAPNSTITSNLSENITKVPQYSSSAEVCKASSETYTTNSIPTNDSNEGVHPNMTQYYKHWIWSRNLFCPQLANSNYLYSNGNPLLSHTLHNNNFNSHNNNAESLNSNSPGQITEINSDDSLESQENDKVNV
jgi:hypothetical protein